MRSAEQINSVFNKPTVHKNYENNEHISFQERVEKAMSKTETVIRNANMVAIANQLLETHSPEEISSMSEEQINEVCDPYDAAVIVAVCQTLESNKKAAN